MYLQQPAYWHNTNKAVTACIGGGVAGVPEEKKTLQAFYETGKSAETGLSERMGVHNRQAKLKKYELLRTWTFGQ